MAIVNLMFVMRIGKFWKGELRRISLHSFSGNNDTQSKIPIIRILLGGGSESIRFILAELKREPPVPVVIISDSGKAADILAYAHR